MQQHATQLRVGDTVSSDVFDTDDFDTAVEFISSHYTAHRPERPPAGNRFHYRVESLNAGPITANIARYAGAVRARNDAIDHFAIFDVLEGRLEVRVADETVRLGPGDVALYRTDGELHTYWSDLLSVFIQLPMDEVSRVAAETYGTRVSEFRIESMSPVSASLATFWHDLSAWITRSMQAPQSPLNHPVLLAEMTRTAIVAALAVFPTTAMTSSYVRGAGRVEPAAVRRAVQFIDEHAAEPVTVGEIADAAGLGVRGLQEAFRRHFDETPMGYLRQIRLERAHQQLRSGDPTQGTTVAEIAAHWGFRHGGHFAELYRERYGQSPRRTLAQ